MIGKLLLLSVLILLGLPPILSLTASYYLHNHFIDHLANNGLARDVQIKHIDYQHGWFNSKARIDFYSGRYNTHIQTQNLIHHGPVIWPVLTNDLNNAFSLYQIDSRFELIDNGGSLSGELNNGMATTRISYLGKTSPVMTHPGLSLRLLHTQLFADLPEIQSQFLTNGTVLTNFSANQLEIQDRYRGFYAVEPTIKMRVDAPMRLPSDFRAAAASVSADIGLYRLSADGIIFNSRLDYMDNRYQMQADLTARQLTLDGALIDEVTINLVISDLDDALTAYFSLNAPELTDAIQNNQWLVLLKHSSALIQLVEQPVQLQLNAQGLSADQSVHLDFSGSLIADGQSNLNPFSMLENLQMKLMADMPMSFIHDLNQPSLSDFLNLMADKGLLIRKNQSYHSKLSFEDAKLSIAH